jgi:hypothetical protein
MAAAVSIMSIMLTLQYCGVEPSFIVWYPMIVVMQFFSMEKRNIFYVVTNLVSMAVIVGLYYMAIYLDTI